MRRDGRPARRAKVNDSAGGVPFAITFDKAGRMLVAEAELPPRPGALETPLRGAEPVPT